MFLSAFNDDMTREFTPLWAENELGLCRIGLGCCSLVFLKGFVSLVSYKTTIKVPRCTRTRGTAMYQNRNPKMRLRLLSHRNITAGSRCSSKQMLVYSSVGQHTSLELTDFHRETILTSMQDQCWKSSRNPQA